MAQAKRGLGKGLGRGIGALFGEDVVEGVVLDKRGSHSHESADGEGEKISRGRKRASASDVKSSEKNQASSEDKGAGKKETGVKNSRNQSLSGEAEKTESDKQVNVSRETLSEISTDTLPGADASSENQAIEKQISASEKAEETQGEIYVKISKIEPNRSQPRKNFDEEQLQQLADSMKRYGVLQPLLVQKRENGFEIIAGERRWRAAKMADLKEVPVVVREYDPQQTMEIALIENVQREDLNPIEEAMAYQQLIQEFNLKQEEIAERVSKSRTTITNSLRLLNLAKEVQQMLVENRLSSGHARALLSLEDPKQQVELAHKIEQNKMSVREVEKAVKLVGKEKKPKKEKPVDEALELVFQDLEERMKTVMGTKVNISRKDKSKGKIEIEYYSESELERIVELIESIR